MMKNSFGRNAKAKYEKMKAADVVVFENPEFGKVRTLTDKQGEPWFCARISAMCSGIRDRIML